MNQPYKTLKETCACGKPILIYFHPMEEFYQLYCECGKQGREANRVDEKLIKEFQKS